MPRQRPIAEDETVEHFRTHGWMRVRGAFSAAEAAAMRAAAWRALAKVRIREGDRSTWTEERPEHLQHLKADPAFGAAWSKAMRTAIEGLLEGQTWIGPRNCGAFFLAFPSRREWSVPAAGWHIDAHYLSPLSPPAGIRVHALFGDIMPRGGATLFLNGSHRLLHQWFKAHPPAPSARGADHRKSLQNHPYICDLHTEGDTEDCVARFMDGVEEVDGIPLQVVENTGATGDVVLAHPLLLHVATANNGREPRFLLSGGVDTEAMWAQAG